MDLPTDIWKLHKETCRYCKPQDLPVKGYNMLKENGGWFNFQSVNDAYAFFHDNRRDTSKWVPCGICNPE